LFSVNAIREQNKDFDYLAQNNFEALGRIITCFETSQNYLEANEGFLPGTIPFKIIEDGHNHAVSSFSRCLVLLSDLLFDLAVNGVDFSQEAIVRAIKKISIANQLMASSQLVSPQKPEAEETYRMWSPFESVIPGFTKKMKSIREEWPIPVVIPKSKLTKILGTDEQPYIHQLHQFGISTRRIKSKDFSLKLLLEISSQQPERIRLVEEQVKAAEDTYRSTMVIPDEHFNAFVRWLGENHTGQKDRLYLFTAYNETQNQRETRISQSTLDRPEIEDALTYITGQYQLDNFSAIYLHARDSIDAEGTSHGTELTFIPQTLLTDYHRMRTYYTRYRNSCWSLTMALI